MQNCPLCSSEVTRDHVLHGNSGASFWKCPQCALIFRAKRDHPEPEEERSRYLSHCNSSENEGYVRFLLRPYQWAKTLIDLEEPFLDYGCGYAPVFVDLMRERGHSCHGYDPLFFPGGIGAAAYPTIFCIETVEHFHNTYAEWDRLVGLMAPGGHLVVMTDFWLDVKAFPNWYYQNDLTHTSFYHPRTLKCIAEQFDLELMHSDEKRMVIFKRP